MHHSEDVFHQHSHNEKQEELDIFSDSEKIKRLLHYQAEHNRSHTKELTELIRRLPETEQKLFEETEKLYQLADEALGKALSELAKKE